VGTTAAGPCPLCGVSGAPLWATARDLEYLTSDETFHYHHCQGCDVLFLDPLPVDRLREIYPPNYYSYSFGERRPSLADRVKEWLDAREMRRVLARLPGAELVALDVGGGAGYTLDRLRRLDPRIRHTQVVDLDPEAARRARLAGHDVFCGRVENFVAECTFDLILLVNLIEHVADPARLLGRLASGLRPDGLLLIKTPNFDSLDARLFRHANWGGLHCPRHWVLFSRTSFARLVERSGLRVREFAYTQGAAFWATSTLFRLARRDLASITKERPAVAHPLFPLLSALYAAFDFVRRPFQPTSQMVWLLSRTK
jgi:SAM-dependent methyltransferase